MMDLKSTEETTMAAENKGKKKRYRVIALAASILIALLLIVYGSIAIYYQSHFFPNTIINGVDCSNLQAAEAARRLDDLVTEYRLEVKGRSNPGMQQVVLGQISTDDINLQFVDTLSGVEVVLQQQDCLRWIQILGDTRYGISLVQGVSFDEDMLREYVKVWDAFQNMMEPKDAYIGVYSEEKGGYEIVAETDGTKLKIEEVIEYVKTAILKHETELNLEELDVYERAAVTTEDEKLNQYVDMANKWLSTQITYDWNGKEVILDRQIIKEWITFETSGPMLDEDAVADFVADNAKERDTYGKSRKFVTTLGIEKTLPSGAYGWKTDREGEAEELKRLIYQGSVLEREPLYISEGRQKGMDDIGSSYVEADLTNQHLYLYYQGNIVLETDFVSGIMTDPGCVTPSGVFGLTYKTKNAVLRGQNYVTPVSYWMPFHGNFGMHDATWRTEFGGDIYLTGGSHGCINLPLDKAAEIYNYVSTGFPVICYY